MRTLMISDFRLPDAADLRRGAQEAGFRVISLSEWAEDDPLPSAFHGDVMSGIALGRQGRLRLLEPRVDVLVELDWPFLKRSVRYVDLKEARTVRKETFLKPADPRDKGAFDPGVVRDGRDIKVRSNQINFPVLAAEPVPWLVEYRCFVADGKIVDGTPYCRHGRQFRYGEGRWPIQAEEWQRVQEFAGELLIAHGSQLPEAFVVDVGFVEQRGWAVVEFNPAWCSTSYGCDPKAVLEVLSSACMDLLRFRRRSAARRKASVGCGCSEAPEAALPSLSSAMISASAACYAFMSTSWYSPRCKLSRSPSRRHSTSLQRTRRWSNFIPTSITCP